MRTNQNRIRELAASSAGTASATHWMTLTERQSFSAHRAAEPLGKHYD